MLWLAMLVVVGPKQDPPWPTDKGTKWPGRAAKNTHHIKNVRPVLHHVTTKRLLKIQTLVGRPAGFSTVPGLGSSV